MPLYGGVDTSARLQCVELCRLAGLSARRRVLTDVAGRRVPDSLLDTLTPPTSRRPCAVVLAWPRPGPDSVSFACRRRSLPPLTPSTFPSPMHPKVVCIKAFITKYNQLSLKRSNLFRKAKRNSSINKCVLVYILSIIGLIL